MRLACPPGGRCVRSVPVWEGFRPAGLLRWARNWLVFARKLPIKLEGELLEAVRAPATILCHRSGCRNRLALLRQRSSRGEKPILPHSTVRMGWSSPMPSARPFATPTKAVVAALVQQLGKTPPNPRDSNAAIALCRTLGKMKAVETVPQLTQLKDKSSDYIAAAAIDALREIGLSATGAAPGKLEKRCLTPEDCKMLVESQDQEALSRLNQIVPGQFDKRVVEEGYASVPTEATRPLCRACSTLCRLLMSIPRPSRFPSVEPRPARH